MENQENNNTEAEFENSNVDPGFEQSQNDNALKGQEDERENNIDANMSLKEMAENKKSAEENDALNYKNDREHGAFNPKNI